MASLERRPSGSALAASRLSGWAAAWSLACGVHCMVAPLLALSLPAATLGPEMRGPTEALGLGGSLLLSAASLCWGGRVHGRGLALRLFAPGAFLVVAGHGAAPAAAETPLVVSGALLLAGSQLLNRWLCRRCAQCADDEP